MIAFTKSYKTSDDQLFGSVEEAKTHELSLVIGQEPVIKSTGLPSEPLQDVIAEMIMANKDIIVDILTTTPVLGSSI